ncbi:MAG: anti-sigma factor family protein [Candidatus Acidiferrales bacterium]
MGIKCEEVWQEISNYLDGEMDSARREEFKAHFAACRECAAVVRGTQNVVALYRDKRLFQPSAGFAERLDHRVRRQIAAQRGTAYGWVLSAAAVLILSLMLFGANRPGQNSPQLIDEHSQPAVRVPVKMVAINEEGKTFHLPTCPYLHGKWKMIPAEEAMRLGYNPCIRCMKDALPQTQFHGSMNPQIEEELEPAANHGWSRSAGD